MVDTTASVSVDFAGILFITCKLYQYVSEYAIKKYCAFIFSPFLLVLVLNQYFPKTSYLSSFTQSFLTWLLMILAYWRTSTTACNNVVLHSFILNWYCTVLWYNEGFLLHSNCVIGKGKETSLYCWSSPTLNWCRVSMHMRTCYKQWNLKHFMQVVPQALLPERN